MSYFTRPACFVFALLLLSACFNNDDEVEVLVLEYEAKFADQNKQISKLEEELKLAEYEKEQLVDISGLQRLDHSARSVMRLIDEEEFEELKSEYNVDFEVEDEKIYFEELDDHFYFPPKIAGLPMYFAYYNPQDEGSEVGYFIYDHDRKYDIIFKYSKDNEFKYVFIGG
ncbi:hypothetical protein LGQ02_12895 [Bacillus shivajii]|uniref:hypothetical protein n=1 Tax=Bacillus shivajii TaxID=1983719 RepID=UPI001CFBB411|nr:hypothetical protein [Bacillus shivajii]UCZ51758.1 hypothetical protein LGQ02_12895 [Bacillus shivajii]